ncbi:MAG: membrane protein insertase YidC [Clostridiales bacterium]|nr:membrane protein insertase YidC [Clostridiales bacterium]
MDIKVSLATNFLDIILGPLSSLFGWVARLFYSFLGSYGLAIIFLTVVIRGLLIPLNVRSQRSMLKMQALSGKQAELQRKYGHDKQRYQEELYKLQQENGAMGCSGCILPLLQLLFIWPIYRVVSGPLHYIAQISMENLQKMIDTASEWGIIGKSVTKENHIALIDVLANNSKFFRHVVTEGNMSAGQMMDLHFLGLDLTKVPSINPATIMKEPSVYIPLLFLPLLVLIVNLVMMRMTTWLKPGYKEQQEAKERAKNNPARAGQVQQDKTESTMKIMNWVMPLMMLFTTFIWPAAMGLYWIISGLMGILSQILVFYLFTKPYELKKAEAELAKANAFKKKAAEQGEGDKSKSKKKKKK